MEYTFILVPMTHNERTESFNQMGERGWRFKQVIQTSRGLEAIFERPIPLPKKGKMK